MKLGKTCSFAWLMKLDFNTNKNRGEAWTMQMANMVKQWWSVRPGENWKSEASPMEIIQRVKPGLTHLLIEWSGGEILTLHNWLRWRKVMTWREEGGSRLQIDACIRHYSPILLHLLKFLHACIKFYIICTSHTQLKIRIKTISESSTPHCMVFVVDCRVQPSTIYLKKILGWYSANVPCTKAIPTNYTKKGTISKFTILPLTKEGVFGYAKHY